MYRMTLTIKQQHVLVTRMGTVMGPLLATNFAAAVRNIIAARLWIAHLAYENIIHLQISTLHVSKQESK